jgi:hypothetical protein
VRDLSFAGERRVVVLVDSYDAPSEALDAWMRSFVAALPECVCVVLEGQHDFDRD